MLGIAGAMALPLGAVGLYGVLAYAVSQRRREIGVRLALGQDPRAVEAMILRQGLTLAALGVGPASSWRWAPRGCRRPCCSACGPPMRPPTSPSSSS